MSTRAAAHVEKGARDAILAPYDDEGLADDAAGKAVTGHGHLTAMADAAPAVPPDCLELKEVQIRVEVEARW